MSTATVNLAQIASQWRSMRRMYPFYAAISQKFAINIPPCRDLDTPIDRSEPEVMQRVVQWFDQMDAKIEVHQIRQLVQTSRVADEENLREVLRRHLAMPVKDKALRDKVDYLMVQYYAHCSSHDSGEAKTRHDDVAEVLHPVLGDVSPLVPELCNELDRVLLDLEHCASLGDLLEHKIIDQARDMKEQAAEKYFVPSVLVAFARFNFLLRRGFFRLMHADLHAVRFALNAMELQGRIACDCSTAGLSANESFAEIRRICHDWKGPYRAAYSLGNTFAQIVAIRNAVEAASHAPVAPMVVAKTGPSPSSISQGSPEVLSPVTGENVESGTPISAAPDEVGDCTCSILDHLTRVGASAAALSNIVFRGSKLVLATWEVAAFLRPDPTSSVHLQRAVAARTLVKLALEAKQRGESVPMSAQVAVARAEMPQLQALIAAAKDKKDIDTAVNLSATAKRLLALLEQAGSI